MLDGKKTFLGLLMIAIGWLSTKFQLNLLPDQIQEYANMILEICGFILSVYGRAVASKSYIAPKEVSNDSQTL